MVDFVPSTNELKKLKFLSPGPKNSTFGAMKSVTRHTIKVERFSLFEKSNVDNPKGELLHGWMHTSCFIYLVTDLTVSIIPTSGDALPVPLVKQESDEKLDYWEKNVMLLYFMCSFSVFSDDQKKIEKWVKEVCIVYIISYLYK